MPKKKSEVLLGLSNAVMEVAAKKEVDHTKEEKVLIKQGNVTKCGYTVREVLKDGRLALVKADELKIVNKDSVKF